MAKNPKYSKGINPKSDRFVAAPKTSESRVRAPASAPGAFGVWGIESSITNAKGNEDIIVEKTDTGQSST